MVGGPPREHSLRLARHANGGPRLAHRPVGAEWVSLNIQVGNGDFRQWVSCSAFGNVVSIAAALHAGQAVYAEGVLELRRWESHDGQQRSGLKVTVSHLRPAELRRQPRKREATASELSSVLDAAPLNDAIDF